MIELFEAARKSLHFVGYQGLSMIAVAGIDMAAWDGLAKAAGVPLCELLGAASATCQPTTATLLADCILHR